MSDTIDVTVRGQTYSVRPTFALIDQIETRLDRSMLSLISDDEAISKIKISEIVSFVYLAVRSAGCRESYESIGNQILKEGPLSFVAFIGEFVSAAITSGPEEPVAGDAKR